MSPRELSDRKVTIVSHGLFTPEESYSLFLAALDSAGLALEPADEFQRVVKGKTASGTSASEHFAKVPMDKLALVAVIQGGSGVRAMFRAPTGEGRIVKPGDRISRRVIRVAKILSDRVVVDSPGILEGERSITEVTLVPDTEPSWRAPGEE